MPTNKPYLQGSVAGIALQDSNGNNCKALLVTGGNVRIGRVVNTFQSADGTVFAQTVNVSVAKGMPFAIHFEYCPKTLFDALVAAFDTALDAQTPVAIAVSDDLADYNFNAIPSAPPTYPEQRTNTQTIHDVVFPFIGAS